MIAAITALLIAGCRTEHSTEQAGKLEYRPAVNEVSVITLEKRPFSLQILSNGKLSAIAGSSLSFAGSGTIAKVNFCNGDRVKKGDVIAELENTDKRMALESASISLKKQNWTILTYLPDLVTHSRSLLLKMSESFRSYAQGLAHHATSTRKPDLHLKAHALKLHSLVLWPISSLRNGIVLMETHSVT